MVIFQFFFLIFFQKLISVPLCLFRSLEYKILFTIINLGVLTLVYNEEINFSSEGHSKSILNIPFIDILKKTACATKQDVLVHMTLQ